MDKAPRSGYGTTAFTEDELYIVSMIRDHLQNSFTGYHIAMFYQVYIFLTIVVLATTENQLGILRQSTDVGIDKYKFSYQTTDETYRYEEGSFLNGVWTVEGSYHWKKDGKLFNYRYLANDKGYQLLPPIPPPPTCYPGSVDARCPTVAALLGIGK